MAALVVVDDELVPDSGIVTVLLELPLDAAGGAAIELDEPEPAEPELPELELSESVDEAEDADWPGLRLSVAFLAKAVKDSMVWD